MPTTGVLKSAKRYTVSKAGSLAAETSCPALARPRCRVSLTLTALAPGHKKAVTIAARPCDGEAGREGEGHAEALLVGAQHPRQEAARSKRG